MAKEDNWLHGRDGSLMRMSAFGTCSALSERVMLHLATKEVTGIGAVMLRKIVVTSDQSVWPKSGDLFASQSFQLF
jgi:hypothetical protein